MTFPRGNIAKIPRGEGSRSSPVHIRPFIFCGGPLGGSRHHFGALLGASGGLLGVFGAPWELLGDPWGPLWAPFVGPWGALATIWVHFGSIFGGFGLQCGSEGSLLHDVGSCGVIFHYFFRNRVRFSLVLPSRCYFWSPLSLFFL